MKYLLPFVLWLGVFTTAALGQPPVGAQSPSTVIHVINVKWKAEATPEQIKAAVEAVRQLPSKFPGIKRVWTKNLKYQGQEGMKQAIVLEFESQDALKKYENSPAQKWWYETYLAIREESATHDITN
jgi:uncharacterized protein (DUF1330 family)